MVTGLIFAGGAGKRMNSKSKPKQFLELHGKSIIIHTLEYFEENEQVDRIVIVCLKEWIDYLREEIKRYGFNKVSIIVEGGKTGQESIRLGLDAMKEMGAGQEDIVLIHDGVRPLITDELLSLCVDSVREHGSAITCSYAKESIVNLDENKNIDVVLSKSRTRIAKAPQCFYWKDIMEAHMWAEKEGLVDFTDSAELMVNFGYKLYPVKGPDENIKITTAADYYIFRAIYEARENSQIFGI